MSQVLLSFAVFIIVSLLHAGCYRLLAKLGLRSFKTVIIYGAGLVFLIRLNWSAVFNFSYITPELTGNSLSLPLTSVLIYLLLSLLQIMFFTSPHTGDVSPTQQVLDLLARHGPLTNSALQSRFSVKQLLDNRLHFLTRSGYVQKRGATYYITNKGWRSVTLINFYRRLLAWESSG